MKLRKILKSMFNNYCKTFKDVQRRTARQYVPITKNLLRQVFLCPDDGGCDYR